VTLQSVRASVEGWIALRVCLIFGDGTPFCQQLDGLHKRQQQKAVILTITKLLMEMNELRFQHTGEATATAKTDGTIINHHECVTDEGLKPATTKNGNRFLNFPRDVSLAWKSRRQEKNSRTHTHTRRRRRHDRTINVMIVKTGRSRRRMMIEY